VTRGGPGLDLRSSLRPEVPDGEAMQEGAAVGAVAAADLGVGRVFPQRGGGVECLQSAADRGSAATAVAAAGKQRDGGMRASAADLVFPGGEEAAELGRDRRAAAAGAGNDAAVGGNVPEVGLLDEVGVADDGGEGDERGELGVGAVVGERGGAAAAWLNRQGRVSPKV
jgi:hypothetical protein